MKKGAIIVVICLLMILFVISAGCITDETNNKNDTKKNHAPSILNFEVLNSWPTGYDIKWNVTDEDIDNLTVSLYYSYDNQTTWEELNTFQLNNWQIWWDFPDTGKNEEFVIKIVVSDGYLESKQISRKITAIPIRKHYKYIIEIIPEHSGWNLLYLPAIILPNGSLSEINEELNSGNIKIIETSHGHAIKINTSTEFKISGELSLSKLDSEYEYTPSFSMFSANQTENSIDTSDFPDEFSNYNNQIGTVWLYYKNSQGWGNISIKIEFEFRGFGQINQAVWGKISEGWQEKEIYEEIIPV
jgi:hypothetical protein